MLAIKGKEMQEDKLQRCIRRYLRHRKINDMQEEASPFSPTQFSFSTRVKMMLKRSNNIKRKKCPTNFDEEKERKKPKEETICIVGVGLV